MRNDERQYHLERERQCRDLAKQAENPDIRKRHEFLASLHAEAAEVPATPEV